MTQPDASAAMSEDFGGLVSHAAHSRAALARVGLPAPGRFAYGARHIIRARNWRSGSRDHARGLAFGGHHAAGRAWRCRMQAAADRVRRRRPRREVIVAQALHQPVTPYLEATGNMVAYNQVDLVARVSGFLQEIRYTDGATAHRGDTLFVIEPAPYQAKLQQAQAALASAQAQAVQTDAEYERQASLGRTDFSSRSQVDQARAARDSNRANVLNDQAGVTLAATNLGYTQVTAPFDGMVTAHQVSVGSLVGANAPTTLATIVQLDPIYVSFTVSEQDVLRIRAGLRKAGIDASEISTRCRSKSA